MLRLSDEDGYTLIRLARSALEYYLEHGRMMDVDEHTRSRYSMKAGVFVTLNELIGVSSSNDDSTMHGKSVYIDYAKEVREELRGCIGFPLPSKELCYAVIEAAVAAGTDDPRFKPVNSSELDRITFELSILTEPELITVRDPREYRDKIKVGRDGLLIVWSYGSGLLLPQVAVEYGWDEERFLCETCMKAGAIPDCWFYPDTRVYRFEAIIFKEIEPNGSVTRVRLDQEES
ncbi:MAG: TIGR00296 family protein [Candidatus Nitrosocaldus sp.]